MKVVGYVRVSTEEQGQNGFGLAAQRRAIEEEAARRGWTLLGVEEDVASGKMRKGRVGLDRAVGLCRSREADALVVAKLDRLSRSLLDFAALLEEARGRWNVVALDLGVDTSTPQGELVANVLASVAQWERRVIGQRTQEGLAEKRAQGWRHPNCLPETVWAHARKLHEAGRSERAIAAELGQHRTTIRRILKATA